MSASPRLRFGIVAAGLSCLLAGYVVAQQETVRERDISAAQRPDTGLASAGQNDVQRFVASCLLAKNQAEVEIGKFAQQQSQNPEVKEFAQKMVQDHGKLVQQLQPLAGGQASGRERTSTSTSEVTPGQIDTAQSQTATRQLAGSSPVDQLIALDRQIVEHCTQAARDALQQKRGAEFDKAYIGGQIHGHMGMLSALEVIGQQGPEQLQQLAQEAQPKVKMHLDHAKQLMQQLDSAGAVGTRSARQPAERQRN